MIDITFDFTTDSYKYWEGFWERNDGLGYGYSDPDSSSPTLQRYHQILWSRELPNGEKMDLKIGSDSIIVTLRYKKYRNVIDQVMQRIPDYKQYYENLIRKAYTIGGMIIFPKHRRSMNQEKGTNRLISDRWDLTLECIRRHYSGEESPLSSVTQQDKDFYDLFVDFKGYVDFFSSRIVCRKIIHRLMFGAERMTLATQVFQKLLKSISCS